MCKLAEDLRKEGELRGRAEGMLEGKLELLISLIKKGLLTLEEASKEYGFTEQQLRQAMK